MTRSCANATVPSESVNTPVDQPFNAAQKGESRPASPAVFRRTPVALGFAPAWLIDAHERARGARFFTNFTANLPIMGLHGQLVKIASAFGTNI